MDRLVLECLVWLIKAILNGYQSEIKGFELLEQVEKRLDQED